MSSNGNGGPLVPHTTPAAPARIGQATAVEQSRAVAEVQAAIVVAQQCPRNVPAAIEMMRESCRRKELAERAFFSYKRGSVITGPSVHLARELARCWGNIQYGLRELRRDDEASEILAFAWDVQTNARNDNIFINPHRRYTGDQILTDLRDVYENNANVGARRVREAIFAVLPAWYVEEAVDICNDTLKRGDGKPLPLRIASALEVFGNLGVTVAQLEAKHGPSARWDERTVAQLLITHRSITRGEIDKDEAFPSERTTVADLIGASPNADPAAVAPAAPEAAPQKATRASLAKLLGRIPLGEPADFAEFLTWRTDRAAAQALADLTPDEITAISSYVTGKITAAEGDTAEAASLIWAEYRASREPAQPALDGTG